MDLAGDEPHSVTGRSCPFTNPGHGKPRKPGDSVHFVNLATGESMFGGQAEDLHLSSPAMPIIKVSSKSKTPEKVQINT